jgi:hypothetical protein
MWDLIKTFGRFARHYPMAFISLVLVVAIVLTATVVLFSPTPARGATAPEEPTLQCVSRHWTGTCLRLAPISCNKVARPGCPNWENYYQGRPVFKACWLDGTDADGQPHRICQDKF